MIARTAAEIAAAVGGELTPAAQAKSAVPTATSPKAAELEITVTGSVVVDSRLVEPGSLFVALPGEHHDGHEFLADAFDAGAALALVTQPTDYPAVIVSDAQYALGRLARHVLRLLPKTRVIALTGSAGKTTTKDLISQIISPQAPTIAPLGSFNNEIGLPLTVLRAGADTRFLVLEMGAAGIGHLDYLTDIAPPDISLVLGVGQAHLGEFGSIEHIAQAKSELVAGTKPGGTTILNGDDPRVAAMAHQAQGRTVRFFGQGADHRGADSSRSINAAGVDLRCSNIAISASGAASFDLSHGRETVRVELQLVGGHQHVNATAAAAVGLELGIPLATIAERLNAAQALSGGRMAVTDRFDGVTIIHDAYNANPESMASALETLARIGHGRRTWAVLGEMRELGPAATEAHERVGSLAVQNKIVRLLAVGQEAAGIRSAGLREGADEEDYRFVPDIAAARKLLDAELKAGDVVLLKASNGTGLWRLGDELAGKREEN